MQTSLAPEIDKFWSYYEQFQPDCFVFFSSCRASSIQKDLLQNKCIQDCSFYWSKCKNKLPFPMINSAQHPPAQVILKGKCTEIITEIIVFIISIII